MIGRKKLCYSYGDELTVEESYERLTGISKICIKGFAAGFVVYGASKIFTPPALAEGTEGTGANVPAKADKVSSAETGALSVYIFYNP